MIALNGNGVIAVIWNPQNTKKKKKKKKKIKEKDLGGVVS